MKKSFKVQNLDCAVCAAKMEKAISKIDGVNSVSLSFMTQRLFVDLEDSNFESIIDQIQKACSKIEPGFKIVR